MTQSMRHVLTIVAVESIETSIAFYRAAFHWQVTVDTPHYVEFSLVGGQRIGIYERTAFGRNTGRVPFATPRDELAPVELYFHCDDLEADIGRIHAAGAEQLSALTLRSWGDEAAYFADPSGNVLVLARRAGTGDQ